MNAQSGKSPRIRRLGSEFPEGWEKDAGSVGEAKMVNWPELTVAEQKKYREELREKQKKKIKLGFMP